MSENNAQSKMIMAIICWFGGFLGIHRFMLGHTGMGVLMLLTGGVCGIMVLVDLIMILTGKLKYADGRELT